MRKFLLLVFLPASCSPSTSGLVGPLHSADQYKNVVVSGWKVHEVGPRVSSQSIFDWYQCPEWKLIDSVFTEVDEFRNGYVFYWFMGGDSVCKQVFYSDGYLKNEEVDHVGGRSVEDDK